MGDVCTTLGACSADNSSTISSRIISATGTKSCANILGSSSNKLIKNSREPLIDKVSNVTWIIWVVAIVVTHVFFKNITQVCNGTWEISETTDTLLAGGSGVIREVKVQKSGNIGKKIRLCADCHRQYKNYEFHFALWLYYSPC